MSQLIGTTVTAKLVPNDGKDAIAATDANYEEGGNHSYAKLNDSSDAQQPFNSLYTLPAFRRKWGMFATVYNDGVNNGRYELVRGLFSTNLADNGNWRLFVADSTTPPAVDPVLQLLTGGDYITDPDYEGVDSFHYVMLPATWDAADGSDKAIADTPFAVAPAATDMFRLDVPCLAPTGSGAVVVVSGPESDTVLAYPPIPAGYIARQSIFVNEDESYPYPYNIPTSNRDGSTGEVRKNSQTFASIDNLEALNGTTVDEKFEIDFAEFQDTETVSVEEGVDPDTGERKIQFNATGGGGGGSYTLPIASSSVLGGIKVGQGLEIAGDGKLSVLATSTNFIFVSPDGDDATGQRGNIGAPYATLNEAQAVYQAGDTIHVNPGVYTAQVSLDIAGFTATYYLAPGANITFVGNLFASGGSNKLIVRGSGKLTGDIFLTSTGSVDIEADELISSTTFQITVFSTARFKIRHLALNGLCEISNSATVDFYCDQITSSATWDSFFWYDPVAVRLWGTKLTMNQKIQLHCPASPANYAKIELHNALFNVTKLCTITGSGGANNFYGSVLVHNSTINGSENAIEIDKFAHNGATKSKFIFDGANLNGGSGASIEVLNTYAGGQTDIPYIEILSGGLTINKDVVFDVTRPLTNLIPGTYAFRTDYSGSAPATSRFSSIKTIDEPGTGGGGGSALTIKDEGTNLSTAATSINFVGAGVTATNTGAAVTVTISGTGASIDSVPTDGSSNAVQSNGVFDALALKADSSSVSLTQQSHTSGATVTIGSASGPLWLIVNPATLLASLTITMPATPVDGQRAEISFGGTMTTGTVVTALTISPNASQALIQAGTPTTAEAGELISYRWKSSVSKWYRIN